MRRFWTTLCALSLLTACGESGLVMGPQGPFSPNQELIRKPSELKQKETPSKTQTPANTSSQKLANDGSKNALTLEPTGEKTEKSRAPQNTLSAHKIDGLLVSKNGATTVVWNDRLYILGGDSSVPLFNPWTMATYAFNEDPLVYNGAFVNTGEMPYEIGGHYPYPQSNALVHNGELYKGVHNGVGGTIRESALYRYDFDPMAKERWSGSKVLQLPLQGEPNLLSLGDKIYAFGGWQPYQVSEDGSALGAPEPAVFEINPKAAQIKQMGVLPAPRSCMWSAAVEGQIYVIGGYGDDYAHEASILRFDPATGKSETIGQLPAPRAFGDAILGCEGAGSAATVMAGRIYIAGGQGWNSKTKERQSFADILEINPKTGQVNTVGQLPSPRYGVSLSLFHNKLYAIGGHDGKTPLSEVLELRGDLLKQLESAGS